MMHSHRAGKHNRRATIFVLSACLIVIMLGMVAFALDIGYMMLVRTQLQTAADKAAMAGSAAMNASRHNMVAECQKIAAMQYAGGKAVDLQDADIEYGTWDLTSRTFTPSAQPSNAIRVTARCDNNAGNSGSFFGRVFGYNRFNPQASAVAMANPRDIAFVVDLSGSMNDDTEPCWATDEIDKVFSSKAHDNIGSTLMQNLYTDLNFGAYPGQLQWIGEPLGVRQDQWAYAEITSDDGPLSNDAIPTKYRIDSNDTEAVRKQKAYSYIIDSQLAALMPDARPTPNSGNSSSYSFYEKYLDYVIQNVDHVDSDQPAVPLSRLELAMDVAPREAWQLLFPVTLAPGQANANRPDYLQYNRGQLPPDQWGNRIDRFNNPNNSTFPSLKASVSRGFRNQVGYRTFTQFLMDLGRETRPDGVNVAMTSADSPFCPWHSEQTAGGPFNFPPRAQPEHAARRALIAAIAVVHERNKNIPDPSQRDWVSIISFDTLSNGGPKVMQSLTSDYTAAMQACTRLQACGDIGASTATESGLIRANHHIRSNDEGGHGRDVTNKVVVLLTDGVPDLYESSNEKIGSFVAQSGDPNFYAHGQYSNDAALMQAASMKANQWQMFPVGIGLGTDYGLMDRLARLGGSANDHGESLRGSGNPAEYEERLQQIFEAISTTPEVRLVQ